MDYGDSLDREDNLGWVHTEDHEGKFDEVLGDSEVQVDSEVQGDNEVQEDNIDHPDSLDDEQHLDSRQRPGADCMEVESIPQVHAEQIGIYNVASKERCGSTVHTVDSLKEPFYKEKLQIMVTVEIFCLIIFYLVLVTFQL